VDYRQAGDIAILTIDNPPVNALSLAVREGLMQALDRAAAAATRGRLDNRLNTRCAAHLELVRLSCC